MSIHRDRVYRLDPQAKEVILSVNPKAGLRSGSTHVDALTSQLRSAGFEVSVLSDIEELRRLAERKHREGALRSVVAAGGDGTVSLVVNTIPVGVPVAVLPLGTENLLSKYLAVSQDVEQICATIRDGHVVRLDAGQANGRLFLLMAGCGFDAEVVRRLHETRTGHIHHLSYLKPILDSIRSYQYPELRIYSTPADGEAEAEPSVRAKWAFVINLPRYAGGLSLVPSASGTDRLLDVCTFREGSFWSGLMYLAGVISGQHQSWQDCMTLRTGRVRIESDARVPYQLDGDPGGFLPLDIEVLPERLTLIVTAAWLVQRGLDTPPQ